VARRPPGDAGGGYALRQDEVHAKFLKIAPVKGIIGVDQKRPIHADGGASVLCLRLFPGKNQKV